MQTQNRPWHRVRRWAEFAGFGAVCAVLFSALPVAAGTVAAPVFVVHATTGGATSGPGHVLHCGHAMITSKTGWVCERTTVAGGVGDAREWVQLQGNAQFTNLSGTQAFWGLGALHLAAGYASLNVTCSSGASAYARVYVFWHVWVADKTLGIYVDQFNSGYIWDSGYAYCPFGGGSVAVSSPPLSGPFNSSSHGLFFTSFSSSDTYVFTFFLGCTAEANVGSTTSSSPATSAAYCNTASSPTNNTFTLNSVQVS